MSLSIGPTPPQPDLTHTEARDEAQRDFARLLYAHSPSWSIDLATGAVVFMCSCNSPGPYNAAALETHILDVVRKARGPVRGPQTKR